MEKDTLPPEVKAELEKIREDLESQIIKQEHRAIPLYINLFKYWQKDRSHPKRKASLIAFIFNALSPASGTILGIPLLTIIGIFVAVIGNQILQKQTALLEKQNELFEVQNKRVEQQTFLAESNRRAALVFELSNILDKIYEELDSTVTFQRGDNNVVVSEMSGEKTKLTDKLEARIIGVSRSLKPYRYLDEEGELIPRPLSPERAQLFVSLASSNVVLYNIAEVGDFSYSDLNGADLSRTDVIAGRMNYSDLRNVNFSESKWDGTSFEHSDIRRARFNNTRFLDVVLSGANLTGIDVFKSDFQNIIAIAAVFDSADINANFNRAKLDGCSFRNSTLNHSTFEESVLYKVSFSGSRLPPAKNFEHASVGEIILEGAFVTDANWLETFEALVNWEEGVERPRWKATAIPADSIPLYKNLSKEDLKYNIGSTKFFVIHDTNSAGAPKAKQSD